MLSLLIFCIIDLHSPVVEAAPIPGNNVTCIDPTPHFKRWENLEWAGGNITDIKTESVSQHDCMCQCMTDKECNGFYFLDQKCILKRGIPAKGAPAQKRDNLIVYRKETSVSSALILASSGVLGERCGDARVKYRMWSNLDWKSAEVTHTLPGKTVEDCMCECMKTNDCQGFAFTNGICAFKARFNRFADPPDIANGTQFYREERIKSQFHIHAVNQRKKNQK